MLGQRVEARTWEAPRGRVADSNRTGALTVSALPSPGRPAECGGWRVVDDEPGDMAVGAVPVGQVDADRAMLCPPASVRMAYRQIASLDVVVELRSALRPTACRSSSVLAKSSTPETLACRGTAAHSDTRSAVASSQAGISTPTLIGSARQGCTSQDGFGVAGPVRATGWRQRWRSSARSAGVRAAPWRSRVPGVGWTAPRAVDECLPACARHAAPNKRIRPSPKRARLRPGSPASAWRCAWAGFQLLPGRG